VKTVVIGLGNPLLGDDGVGWRVADEVNKQLDRRIIHHDGVDIEKLSLGGLSLMERLIGYDRAILIDAINLGQKPVGGLYAFDLKELADLSLGHMTAAHDTSLQTALEIGRSLGLHLPTQISIIGIEAKVEYTFSDSISPEVDKTIPHAAQIALDLLESEKISIHIGILTEEQP
jgi:hydrogenase maturation protease